MATTNVRFSSVLGQMLVGILAGFARLRDVTVINAGNGSQNASVDTGFIGGKKFYSQESFDFVAPAILDYWITQLLPATRNAALVAAENAVSTPAAFAAWCVAYLSNEHAQEACQHLALAISVSPATGDLKSMQALAQTKGYSTGEVEFSFIPKATTKGSAAGKAQDLLKKYFNDPSRQAFLQEFNNGIAIQEFPSLTASAPVIIDPEVVAPMSFTAENRTTKFKKSYGALVPNPLDKVTAELVASFRTAADVAAAKTLWTATFTKALPAANATSLDTIADYAATMTIADLKA